jgi:hypothetical protein
MVLPRESGTRGGVRAEAYEGSGRHYAIIRTQKRRIPRGDRIGSDITTITDTERDTAVIAV